MSTAMMFLILFMAFGFLGAGRRRWAVHHDGRGELEATRREIARLRETVEDLASRFHKLETERDFYRELMSGSGGGVEPKGTESSPPRLPKPGTPPD